MWFVIVRASAEVRVRSWQLGRRRGVPPCDACSAGGRRLRDAAGPRTHVGGSAQVLCELAPNPTADLTTCKPYTYAAGALTRLKRPRWRVSFTEGESES